MKLSALPLLACPAPGSRTTAACGGPLALEPGRALPPRYAEGDGQELLEGTLRCSGCRTLFPVVGGVAILWPRPQDYIAKYHRSLTRDLERYGSPSPAARQWLKRQRRALRTEEYGADFRFSQQFEAPGEVARAMREDADAFYGAFAEWVRTAPTPYDTLAGWARAAPRRQLVLDAGCGGGGLLARIADAFAGAFGVDLSFLAVLLARRVLLHRPERERTYLLSTRCGTEVERPVAAQPAPNAEFVVGDCAAPPFAAGLFDVVCSSNVVDIAGFDVTLDAAARALAPGGRLVLSDPFFFRAGEQPEGEPVAALRDGLRRRGLRIEEEVPSVPWVWATYDRHWRVYFSYCVAARAEGARP
jgi:SAM-dependent methyltransferase